MEFFLLKKEEECYLLYNGRKCFLTPKTLCSQFQTMFQLKNPYQKPYLFNNGYNNIFLNYLKERLF